MPRTNWTLPAVDRQPSRTRARIRAPASGDRPESSRRAGATKTSKETRALTGLPGSVKIGTRRSPSPQRVPKPWGLPGCIATWSKRTVPSCESAALTAS